MLVGVYMPRHRLFVLATALVFVAGFTAFLVYQTIRFHALVFIEPPATDVDLDDLKPPAEGAWWPGLTCRLEPREDKRVSLLLLEARREHGSCNIMVRGPRVYSLEGLKIWFGTMGLHQYGTPVVYLNVLGDSCYGFECYSKTAPNWRTVGVAPVPILRGADTDQLTGNLKDRVYLSVTYEYTLVEYYMLGIPIYRYWTLTPRWMGNFEFSAFFCKYGLTPCEREPYTPPPKLPWARQLAREENTIIPMYIYSDRVDPLSTTIIAVVHGNTTTYARVYYYGTPKAPGYIAPYLKLTSEWWFQGYWSPRKPDDCREILFTTRD